MKNFVHNFFSRPPVIFPLVACFLIFLTINEVQLFLMDNNTDPIYKLRPVFMAMMTVFWIGATFLHKWGALGFLFCALLTAAVYYFLPGSLLKPIIGDVLMLRVPYQGKVFPIPFTIIFAFTILYYFRNMK